MCARRFSGSPGAVLRTQAGPSRLPLGLPQEGGLGLLWPGQGAPSGSESGFQSQGSRAMGMGPGVEAAFLALGRWLVPAVPCPAPRSVGKGPAPEGHEATAVVLKTLFIKKYIFFPQYIFQPIIFFFIQVKGGDANTPWVRTRRICWAIPGTKDKNSD